MKCCVLTRFVYEIIYMNAFIEHYINLGFDKIIILYTDIIDPEIPAEFKKHVLLFKVKNNGNKTPDMNKHLIPSYIDWILHVDSDEFLLLHKRYNSIHDFVDEKTMEHPEINIFFFIWSWVHKFDDNEEKLDDIFKKCKKMVGSKISNKNKDKKEVWVKSMFRRRDLKTLYIHSPSMKKSSNIYCNEYKSIDMGDNKIKTLFYKNIQDEVSFFRDAVLMHIATRSIKNAIFKSNNMHKTQVKKKNMSSKDKLINYVNSNDMLNENVFEIMSALKTFVGYKIEWPLKCLEMNEIVINISDFLRGNQEYNFIEGCKNEYYSAHERSVLNNSNLNIAIERVIKKFNIIFLE